jgi:hypothetical protein
VRGSNCRRTIVAPDPHRLSPETHREGGQALVCGLSLARLNTAKLDARHAAGETLDKIVSLRDLMRAFA